MAFSNSPLKTPVLLIVFNRPDTTKRVFERIRAAQPKHLFVAADGPRNESDRSKCDAARAIVNEVDWDCEVTTRFLDTNQGCRRGVSSAINWFFEHVEEGIVLEDDCLPIDDFFRFAEDMLTLYRAVDRVMHINGSNFQYGQHRRDGSYYFSRIPHIWGWATWRRAWKLYDLEMKDFPSFLSQNQMKSFFSDQRFEKFWMFFFHRAYRESRTWDYQWVYTIMKHHGLAISPNENLVSNIGFGRNATFTKTKHPFLSNMDVYPLPPTSHPQVMEVDHAADLFAIQFPFGKISLGNFVHIWMMKQRKKRAAAKRTRGK
ncbi:MAG: nucleotide-diphospho-sugar transferase [Flammeovirgaceae bacterium]